MRTSKAGTETRRIRIVRIRGGTSKETSDLVVHEAPVTIFLNDEELATFMCSPRDFEQLAVGFLFTEGLISGGEDVRTVTADESEGVVWVETRVGRKSTRDLASRRLITTGCGRGLSFHDPASGDRMLKVRSSIRISPVDLTALMKEFQLRSELYRQTGGVHSAALCDRSKMLVLKEDIGRHNAIDKVVGDCLINGVETTDRILLTSGRISSEMLIKAARAKIPIVSSKSAPTDLGVSLAKQFGITLVGFARGSRMNVYSYPKRLSRR